jgi:hypothetical protein
MDAYTERYYSLTEIMDTLRSIAHYCMRKWSVFVLFILVGASLGGFYRYNEKPKYEATTTFILEEKSGTGGGLSGLASQFGFNLGGMAEGGLFSGDNILNILKSRKIVEQVLLTKVEVSSGSPSLADVYLDFTGLRKRWNRNSRFKEIHFPASKEECGPLVDSVLNVVYENLIEKNLSTDRTSKQGSIISVKVTAANSDFARLMSQRLVQEAGKMYLDIRVGATERNIKQLQDRSDSLLVLLNNRSYKAASSQLLDINPGIKTAAVPVEIANRDKTVLGTLYAEVTKNLEASKVLLSQQTPIIQLLDTPGYLLEDQRKSMLYYIVIGSVIGGLVFFVFAFTSYFLSVSKDKQFSDDVK